jgi:hypothetical protein
MVSLDLSDTICNKISSELDAYQFDWKTDEKGYKIALEKVTSKKNNFVYGMSIVFGYDHPQVCCVLSDAKSTLPSRLADLQSDFIGHSMGVLISVTFLVLGFVAHLFNLKPFWSGFLLACCFHDLFSLFKLLSVSLIDVISEKNQLLKNDINKKIRLSKQYPTEPKSISISEQNKLVKYPNSIESICTDHNIKKTVHLGIASPAVITSTCLAPNGIEMGDENV